MAGNCEHCGLPVGAGDVYCGNCGQPVAAAGTATALPDQAGETLQPAPPPAGRQWPGSGGGAPLGAGRSPRQTSWPDHEESSPGKLQRWVKRPLVWLWALITAVTTAVAILLATTYLQKAVTPAAAANIELDNVTVTSPLYPGGARVDFQLRNTGNQLAIIKGLRLTVQQFVKLPHCESQGNLPTTGRYPANMPTDPAPGTTIDIPASQQLSPDSADRFDIVLRLQQDRSASVYLYRVHIYLLYNNSTRLIDAHEALIALPFAPNGEYFWTSRDAAKGNPFPFLGSSAAAVSKCMITNSGQLRAILALRGNRPAGLTAIPPSLSFCCTVKASPSIVKALRCPGTTGLVRPVSMIIGCDGSADLEFMKWSAWTSSYAAGTGIEHINNCLPNCAVGKFHDYPVVVRFDNPVYTPIAGWTWNRAVLRYPGKKPFGQGTIVLDNFAGAAG